MEFVSAVNVELMIWIIIKFQCWLETVSLDVTYIFAKQLHTKFKAQFLSNNS